LTGLFYFREGGLNQREFEGKDFEVYSELRILHSERKAPQLHEVSKGWLAERMHQQFIKSSLFMEYPRPENESRTKSGYAGKRQKHYRNIQ
jgi:hypothetical protein